MSGGTFEYKEQYIYDIACAMDLELYRNITHTDNKLKPETVKAIRKITKQMFKLYKQVHAVDYFFACDSGEESFLKTLQEIK